MLIITDKEKRNLFLEKIVSIISFIFPLSALPQIYNIWILNEVAGVSITTWILFLLMQIPLFLYAIIHEDKKLQTMFGLWCLMYGLVIIGIIVYS
ncbi:MAG: hypothetical protein LAT82_01820 [Nanoarchaeota archaeon]|nr:hypothetical protein [Nanoarchaeota archaeon]